MSSTGLEGRRGSRCEWPALECTVQGEWEAACGSDGSGGVCLLIPITAHQPPAPWAPPPNPSAPLTLLQHLPADLAALAGHLLNGHQLGCQAAQRAQVQVRRPVQAPAHVVRVHVLLQPAGHAGEQVGSSRVVYGTCCMRGLVAVVGCASVWRVTSCGLEVRWAGPGLGSRKR